MVRTNACPPPSRGRARSVLAVCLLALGSAGLVACAESPSGPVPGDVAPGASEAGTDRPAPPIPDDATLPPGHPPLGAGGGAVTAPVVPDVPPPPPTTLPFTWDLPEGWAKHDSASPMRACEFAVLPDEGAPRLVVYQGIGGGDQANIDRWIGQFKQADGSETRERAEVTTAEREGLLVTRVKVPGTFSGQMVPGKGPALAEEDWLFLGGIVEVGGHKYHLKLQGPADQIGPVEASFDAWLQGLRPAGDE